MGGNGEAFGAHVGHIAAHGVVYDCPSCGAIVRDVMRERHQGWHEGFLYLGAVAEDEDGGEL